jgi:hypothetical protein
MPHRWISDALGASGRIARISDALGAPERIARISDAAPLDQ